MRTIKAIFEIEEDSNIAGVIFDDELCIAFIFVL